MQEPLNELIRYMLDACRPDSVFFYPVKKRSQSDGPMLRRSNRG